LGLNEDNNENYFNYFESIMITGYFKALIDSILVPDDNQDLLN